MMRRTIPFALAALALCQLAAPGCGSSNGAAQCYVGADCASGACSASGQCVAAPVGDGGLLPDGGSSVPGDASSGGEASSDSSSPPPPSGEDGSACVPNNDGTITFDEVPMAAGLRATYLVADNVTWNTAGTGSEDAGLTWDLTGALSGDQDVIFSALTPTGTWWASSFTAATFAMQLEASQTLLGVFEVGSGALSLIGVVSPTSTAPSTEVTYATPIPTLQFPFHVGSTWTTTSSITGTISGIDTVYSETYVTTVDAAGEMKTPYGDFSVLRVGTLLTQTPEDLIPSYTQSFVWVAECVGPVAAATSASSATKPTATEFSSDAEVRRLTP